ncbi:MAG: HAD hydrolase-like protein [Candidatus Diapherotrites archaeon]|nr:HAD hydrolase-like protein [Candidatus Diapherotrites archaeon]
MNALVLFDIDKTLLVSKLRPSTQRMAFSIAIKEVYGIDTHVDLVDHRGMTDQQILIEVLKLHGFSDSEIKGGLLKCMQRMGEFFNENVRSGEFEVLGGVRELLKTLQREGTMLGLVTGNLKPIAKRKLEGVNLWSYFKVGAFGSDSPNRADLVRLAVERAKEEGFKPGKIFVVGDTIRDVEAAKNSGVRNIKTIAVATGDCSPEDLRKAGADFVFEDLEDINKVLGAMSR